MVSVIISTCNPLLFNKLKENIAETIGVPFEIIGIENQNSLSICEAYNLGARNAQFPILCFVHEDVLFRSEKWGKTLAQYFKDIPNLGCIGVAGATYKTKAPSGWWDVKREELALHIIQHFKDKSCKLESVGWKEFESFKEVAVIDGVFIVTNKSDNLKFDEDLCGFHGYDSNISLEARKNGLKVIVTREILLEHLSFGNINKEWFIAVHKVHKKYKQLLPISLNYCAPKKELEVTRLETFINASLNFGLKRIAFYYWIKFISLKPITKSHYNILKRLL